MWVVGLGNPGSRYAETRHNVGMDVVAALVESWKATPLARTGDFAAHEAKLGGTDVRLITPLAYMNRSGEALAAFEVATGESPVAQETLILTDDVYLPVGTLRIRRRGSAGGHRGLESVEEFFGTADYPRLRIGVGSASSDELVDHVLSEFEERERDPLQESLKCAQEVSEVWIREGIESAMNRFNRRSKEEDS